MQLSLSYIIFRWHPLNIILQLVIQLVLKCMQLTVVQLKGNLTHSDRAYFTYWLKACGYISPYWRVRQEKPANIISVKGKNVGEEGITAGLQAGTYFSFSDYVHIHTMHSHLAYFLYSILHATAACITMPRLDIDTSRRVVFSRVFLKSAGYLVSQIKNRH